MPSQALLGHFHADDVEVILGYVTSLSCECHTFTSSGTLHHEICAAIEF